MFGDPVTGPVEDVTPTLLRQNVLATLRQADYLANEILIKHSKLLRC